MTFTGNHLLIDLHGCTGLDDIAAVDAAMRAAVAAAGATLLDLRLHGFGEGQGVTGIALLAESHISIHTWPEHDYAAADIFLCGSRHDLDAACTALTRTLQAETVDIRQFSRGYSLA